MPVFSQANEDAKAAPMSEITQGPRVGFLESFKVSVDAQVRASSQYGIEQAMFEVDDQQYRAMKNAGIEDAPRLSKFAVGNFASAFQFLGPNPDGGKYRDTVEFYKEGGSETEAQLLNDFNDKMEVLKPKHPELNLSNARERVDFVTGKAQEAEHKLQTQKRTMMGVVGEFLGGAVASMSPTTDPFNFITMGVGGAGKTVAMRIAGQVGAQGVIETVNQVTGVQRQRELLGLSHGIKDAAIRIGGTAIAGGVLQGGGELLAAGGKRFFRNTKKDPSPLQPGSPPDDAIKLLEYKPKNIQDELNLPDALRETRAYEPIMEAVSPHSNNRAGRIRTKLDVDYMTSRLDTWSGPNPHEVTAKMDTAAISPPNEFYAPKLGTGAGPTAKDLDVRAREVDPRIFRKYDELAARKQEYRRWLDEMRPDGDTVDKQLSKLVSKMDALTDKIEDVKTPARARKKAVTELEELQSTKDEQADVLLKSDSPAMARVRKELLDTDFKMRDMSPEVSRAYARAKEVWALEENDRAVVSQMVREGRTDMPKAEPGPLDDVTYEDVVNTYERGLTERAPILKQRDKVAGKVPADADAATVASAIIKENMKVLDAELDGFRALLDTNLDPKVKNLKLPGVKNKIPMDTPMMSTGRKVDGREEFITVREYLEIQREAEFDLEAVKTCSIK